MRIHMTMNIDLPLLLQQKQALLRAIEGSSPRPRVDQQLLDGVLVLMDALHDACDPPEAFTREGKPDAAA